MSNNSHVVERFQIIVYKPSEDLQISLRLSEVSGLILDGIDSPYILCSTEVLYNQVVKQSMFKALQTLQKPLQLSKLPGLIVNGTDSHNNRCNMESLNNLIPPNVN